MGGSGRVLGSAVFGFVFVVAVGTACGHSGSSHSPVRRASIPDQRATPPTRSAAPPARSPVAFTAAWLTGAIQDVSAGSPEFGLRDSTGTSMQTLKVVPYPGGYLGVYHCLKANRFEVRLATSTDLRVWTFRTVLDTDASQPTLASAPHGGYLLAVEADNDAHSGPGRRFLRFRFYPSAAALLSRRPQGTFVAPHTLTAPLRGAEGTPSIDRVAMGANIAHSRIDVGFHYLIDGVDREARGVLTNFRSWQTRPDTAFDQALLAIGMRGKHGDRDAIDTRTGAVEVVECQDGSDPIWHIALYDPMRAVARRLSLATAGGSTSFANPTVTYATLPNGKPGIVITMFVPETGSVHGELGELLYSRQISAPGAAPTATPVSSSSRP